MIFSNLQTFFYFLFPITLLIIYLIYLKIRKKDLKILLSNNFLKNELSIKIRHFKMANFIFSIIFMIIALIKIQFISQNLKKEKTELEILFILDNSLSMLANDIYVNPNNKKIINRFNISKKYIEKIIDSFKEKHNLSLMLFSKNSQLECPFTLNSKILKNLYLKKARIAPNIQQGTKISIALEHAVSIFSNNSFSEKIIIIFSDGEDHNSNFKKSLKKLNMLKIKIISIGVGTEKGSFIPIKNYKGSIFYKKDFYGKIVLSKRNDKILKKLSKETNGNYYIIDSKKSMNKFYKKLKTYQNKKEDLLYKKNTFENKYYIFLIFSLIFFLLGLCISEKSIEILKKYYKAIFFPFFLFSFASFSKNINYKKVNISKIRTGSQKEKLNYLNKGNKYFKKKEYKKAIKEYKKALLESENEILDSEIYYNIGRTETELNNFKNAENSYKKSLKINQYNKNSRYNYYILKKYIEKKYELRKKNIFFSNMKKKKKYEYFDRNKLKLLMKEKDDIFTKKEKNIINNYKFNEKLNELYKRDQLNKLRLSLSYQKNTKSSYKDW